jgi:ribosomal protein L34E
MWEDDPDKIKLVFLNVTCTSSACDSDLHCFKATATLRKKNQAGICRDCGANLIDWERVHERDLADVQHTFQALRNEMVRHYYCHVTINQRAINHALRKGRLVLRDFARKQLQQLIGKTQHPREGRQTPRYDSKYADNVIYFAQHATASCCRECVEYWHGIPRNRELTEQELDYLTELAMMYVDTRVPGLTDEKQIIPVIYKKSRE